MNKLNNKTCIRIFWKENNKDKTKRIYPKNVPEMKWENGLDLYIFGYTEVCKFFNVFECPEHLDSSVEWCYEYMPSADVNKDLSWQEQCEKIYNTDNYKFWYQLFRESLACRAADSMLTDAYRYLIEACRHHEDCIYDRDYEEISEFLTNREWKEPFWVYHLFEDYIGLQTSNPTNGSWIFKDGSYITVKAGNHRRIVEGYMGLKEQDVERDWVKIQLYDVYTHDRMTDAQKKTLNNFFKKYSELYETDVLLYKYGVKECRGIR